MEPKKAQGLREKRFWDLTGSLGVTRTELSCVENNLGSKTYCASIIMKDGTVHQAFGMTRHIAIWDVMKKIYIGKDAGVDYTHWKEKENDDE